MIGASKVARDITTQKKIDRVVRESEERFYTLAESVPHMVWMANPDGWIFWYNRRWFEYTGTTDEEMVGWGCWLHRCCEMPVARCASSGDMPTSSRSSS